jgi:hypothetical protein
MRPHPQKKGIEVTDLTVGTGEESTSDSIVAVNVREFLRRGDEVSPSPLLGTRHVIDLGRRDCIAGLRYGIPGMRVGGTREIIVSPHLAYGEAGIPGRIPANALLRCRVELLEIRQHSALLPQDWLPGKVLMISRGKGASAPRLGWNFSVHEGGTTLLSFGESAPDGQHKHALWKQIPIPLEGAASTELIRSAIELPLQMPEDCVDWNSGFIDSQDGGRVIRDKRSGTSCMVIQVIETGKTLVMIGVHEESATFRQSAFFRTVEQLTMPYLTSDSGPSM